jgi:Ca-activated chloride channel homolog
MFYTFYNQKDNLLFRGFKNLEGFASNIFLNTYNHLFFELYIGKTSMKKPLWQIFALMLITPQWVLATGLQPISTNTPVRVQAVDFDLEMRSIYISGIMEVQFVADSGEENAANLRFPLPPESVLHKAEIYLPSQEQWATAETMGRKEGQIIYDQIVQQKFDPLLIQKIGTDFYRARIYPINEQGDLWIRVHYAHTLETADNQYRLRIPFANPDSTAATPANGVTISLSTNANAWTAGPWQISDEMGTPSTVNLDNGTAFLNLEDFTMAQDITLDLQPKESIPQATALVYQPEAANLPGHLHAWWRPDFADYPKITSQPRNVVFVIDVSGSMSGAKMAQTRQAVIRSLEALNDEDYYGLVAFDHQVYVFRPNMRSGADIGAAIEWVSGLDAMGSTGMSAGLTTGTAIGLRSPLQSATIDLLMITDGRPNEGSSTLDGILADVRAEADELARQIRIFSVGIGYDLDQALLNGLAQQTNGESTFALDDNEITGQILDLFARVRGGGISNAIATVQMTELQDNQLTWRRIFPGIALHLSAKGEITSQITLNLTGELSDATSLTLNTTASLLNPSNARFSQIAAPLVAKAWTDALERQIDEAGETQALVNQAVSLARTYGIVTRYTSLLALESEELYAEQGVERIARDPAGIALQAIEIPSSVDEGRIGGQGTSDSEKKDALPPGGPQPQPISDTSSSDFCAIAASTGGACVKVTKPEANDIDQIADASTLSDGEAFEPEFEDEAFAFIEEESDDFAGNSAVIQPAAPLPTLPTSSGGTSSAGTLGPTFTDSRPPPPDIFCEVPMLDGQLQLDIPRVNYQGDYYWASLQINALPDGTLTLTVLNYGPVASPNQNASSCQPDELRLSATLQLSIPSVFYEQEKITDVILQAIPTTEERLVFEVVSYTMDD